MKIINTILAFVLFTVLLSAQVAPPTNLTATVQANSTHHKSVKLTWLYGTPATNLIKFNIYKKNGPLSDTSAHFTKIAWTWSKSFTDNNVQTGHTYSYYVTAVRHDTQSVPSNMVEASIVAPVINYGKISGHLFSDSGNTAIYRGKVEVIGNAPGTFGTIVMTDSNGWFSAKVKTGTYVIYTFAQGFFGEYYNNVRTRSLATPVTVNTNDSLLFEIGLEGIVPPVLYTVTGSVKDSLGVPVKSDMFAYSTGRNWFPSICRSFHTRTDSLGNYSFTVKSGDTIVVYAKPLNNAFIPQYYNDKTTFALADRIPVTANVADINFILHAKPVYANGVSGNVMDSAGVNVLKGKVYIYRQINGHFVYKAQTKADTVTGAYSFVNLEPGDYLLFGDAPQYFGTYWRIDGAPTSNWRNADSVVVTATGTVENINFRLRARHFNGDGGDAVVFGTIFADRLSIDGAVNTLLNDSREVVGVALTDVDGSYFIENLTPGTYTMVTSHVGYADVSTTIEIAEGQILVGDINASLRSDGVTGTGNSSVINGYALSQNYPNPFNPSTVISYQLPQNSFVTLKIYNILGSEVVTLVNQEQTAGKYDIKFNASDLSSGIYLYKIQAGNFTSVKKLTLIK